MKYQVYILWGSEAVDLFYDYSKWTQETASQMLSQIEVFEWNTEDEAEAFRIGLCAVRNSGRDFDEIMPESYKSIKKMAESRKKKAA